MGLDLDCNGLSIRVGSYSSVMFVRHFLIDAIKNYIENSLDFSDASGCYYSNKKELLKKLDYCYHNYYEIEYLNLINYDLNGFECFINHSDCQGYINSNDAYDFIKLCDKLNDYFDKNSIYFRKGKFYLYDIFQESVKSGEDICFC